MQAGAVDRLCWGSKEGWRIPEEERERFGALIEYKSGVVVLCLEDDVEAGPESGPSERKSRWREEGLIPSHLGAVVFLGFINCRGGSGRL